MKNSKKKLSNNQITAIVIAAIIAVAAIGVGIWFGVKEAKTLKTDYGNASSIQVVDNNTLTFNYSCPYDKKGLEFKVDNNKKVVLEDMTDEKNPKSYSATVESVTYDTVRTEEYKGGKINIKLKVGGDFEFKDGVTYRFTLPAGTITELGDNYQIEEISEAFVCVKNGNNGFYVDRTEIKNYETEEIDEVEFSIVKEEKKYYINAVVSTDKFTKLNNTLLENLKTGVTMALRDESGMHLIRTYADNITADFSYENGTKVLIKTLIPDNDLIIEGTVYTFTLEEGLISNDAGDKASLKYKGEYTYMG